MRSLRFLLAPLILCVIGCTSGPRFPQADAESGRARPYEYGLVEPRILISDTLFTLISGSAIDSFEVAESESGPGARASAIVFEIDRPDCFVSISLRDHADKIVHPLLARLLKRGFYRVRVHSGRISYPIYGPTAYQLQVDYCERSQTVPISP